MSVAWVLCKFHADRVRTGGDGLPECRRAGTASAGASWFPGFDGRSSLLSCSEGRGHRSDADDIEGSAEIIGKRSEAELAADIVETAHEEGALVHPLLDRAE